MRKSDLLFKRDRLWKEGKSMDKAKRKYRVSSILELGIIKVSHIVALAVFTFIAVNSFLFTGSNYNYQEIIIFTRDSLLLNTFIILFVAFAAGFFIKYYKNPTLNTKKFEVFMFITTLVVGQLWLQSSRIGVVGEGYEITRGAAELYAGYYNRLSIDNYYGMFPFQLGYSLFCEIVYFIFGNENYAALQWINSFAVAFTNVIMLRIGMLLYKDKKAYVIHGIMILLFFPQIMFVTFTYGVIIGLFFAVTSLWLAILYTRDRKLISLILCLLSISVAVIMKSNYLIFAVAIVLLIAMHSLNVKSITAACFLPLFIAFTWFAPVAVTKLYEYRSGGIYDLSQSTPKIVWIAMGLSDDGPYMPGWFNGLSYSALSDAGYDTKIASDNAKEIIRDRLEYFSTNPKEALSFFYTKTVSQWNEPSYGGLVLGYGVSTTELGLVWKAIYGNGFFRNFFLDLLNGLHLVTFCGGMIFLFISIKKKLEFEKLIVAIIVIGGFLFHLAWEGKSQYILQYGLIAQIPAVPGILWLGEKSIPIIEAMLGKTRSVKRIDDSETVSDNEN